MLFVFGGIVTLEDGMAIVEMLNCPNRAIASPSRHLQSNIVRA